MARKVGEIQEQVMPWKPGKCFKEEKVGFSATERSSKVKTDVSIDFGSKKLIADCGW